MAPIGPLLVFSLGLSGFETTTTAVKTPTTALKTPTTTIYVDWVTNTFKVDIIFDNSSKVLQKSYKRVTQELSESYRRVTESYRELRRVTESYKRVIFFNIRGAQSA